MDDSDATPHVPELTRAESRKLEDSTVKSGKLHVMSLLELINMLLVPER